MRGKAEQILPTGETVVRIDHGTVLVPNVIPGDIIDLELKEKRRGAARGELVTVIEASASRVNPPCPAADRCGGCSLQFLAADTHAALKSGWVYQAFRDCVDDTTDWIPAQPSAGRRRRVRWSVGQDDDGTFLGFQERASHQPVRQTECMAVTDALLLLRRELEHNTASMSGISSLQAIQLNDGIHVVLEGEPAAARAAEPRFDSVAGLPLQWWLRNGHGTRPLGRPVRQFHDRLPGVGKLPDIQVEIGPDDFIQAEETGNREMIRQLHAWAGEPRRAADLFAGVGNLSLSLAAAGIEVIGAEVNASSVLAANRNAKRLGVPAKYIQADLFDRFDTAAFTGLDLIILDPPRKGARKVCEQVGRMLPRRIIMVSCDSAAGARDGAILQRQGYRLRALRALDLFPYAGHVEAISLWSQ
ncbi:MAG TPA: methyltransferase [Mariprofundaceae bacterium]|nr:methyltransferase [Mariprofundaceae bacterium]